MRLRRFPFAAAGFGLLLIILATGVGAQTPRALWEDRVVPAPIVGPTLSGDTLWVVGTNRKIQSHDVRTGRPHWKRTLPAHPVLAPLATEKSLIVGIGAPRPMVILLDRVNGKEQARIGLEDAPVGLLPASDYLLFATTGGSVGAFRSLDGSVVWKREVEGTIAGCAADTEAFWVLGRADSLWCFDPVDGRRRWSVAIEGTHCVAPVLFDSLLLRVTYQGELVAHDRRRGQVVVRRSLHAPQIAPPAFADGGVATVATGGELDLFTLDSAGQMRSIDTGETVAAGVRAWGAWWVVPTVRGRVLAWKRSRDVIEWSLTFRAPISSPPAANANYLVLVDDKGRMVVYEREGGS